MDPFTEKLLERTRARRENLQKKMASRPTPGAAASSKRAREPLAESNSVLRSGTHTATAAPQPSSKPSPSKRSRSGEMAVPPQLQVGGEENREPGPPPGVPPAAAAAALLSDPRTDKKPPAGPASVRSSSSSLEKTTGRPVIQAPPPEPLVEKQTVTPPPPQRPVSQTEHVQAGPPEPEEMLESPAAPEPPQSYEEPRWTGHSGPGLPATGGAWAQPAREEKAEPKEAPPPASGAGGMKSRLQRLAEKRHCWDNNGDSSDDAPAPPSPPRRRDEACVPAAAVAPPSSSSSSPPPSAPPPVGRRGRLAHLAAAIGSWEDDLSHPVTRGKDDDGGQHDKPGSAWAAKMAARDAAAKQPAAAAATTTATAAAQRMQASQPAGSSSSKTPSSTSEQTIVDSPVKASRVVPPSAQQAGVPAGVPGLRGALAPPASPQKTPSHQGLSYQASPQKKSVHSSSSSTSLVVSQSALKDRGLDFTFSSPRKPELGAKPLTTAGPSGPTAGPQSREKVPTKDPGTTTPLPQKAKDPGTTTPLPQKAKDPGTTAPLPQKAKDPGTTAPLPQKATAGPTGVKSFAERFGERRQERTNHGSPAAAAAGSAQQTRATPAAAVLPGTRTVAAVTPGVSPSTRLVQERLRVAQAANTATADLTQRQKLERESELAQIRSRFQKGSGNMWKNNKEEELTPAPGNHPEEPTAPRSHAEIKVVEPVRSQSVDEDDFSNASNLTYGTEPFSTASNYTSSGNLLAVSPPAATSSPLRIQDMREKTSSSPLRIQDIREKTTSSPLRIQDMREKTTSSPLRIQDLREKISSESVEMSVDQKTSSSSNEVEMNVDQKTSSPSEVEQSVDQSITSAVINHLFEGVYDEEEDEDDEEDGLNISSMSLLAPMEESLESLETVAAVVKSPERRMMMTSTPAGSFCGPADCVSKPSKFQRARVTRGGSADAIDENLPYSVDAYRSIKKKDGDRPDVKQVIVRKEDVSKRRDEPPRAAAAATSIKHKTKLLSDEMNLQQTIIHQASQALNCCTDQEHGKGSQVEAEAERLLLVATERRATVKAALDRLKTQGSSSAQTQGSGGAGSSSKVQEDMMGVSASKGSVSLLELRLPLKADFVCSAANAPESANHYFFLMIRAGAEKTVATPLASTRSALSGDALTFTTTFTMSDVSSDFEIDIEVYYLVQKRELVNDKRKKPSKSKAITPKRFLAITKTSQTPVLASPGGPNSVRSSNFSLVGSHKLTLASIGKTKFPLTKIKHDGQLLTDMFHTDMFQYKVPFRCPMEGHISLKLQCQVDCRVEERGFLTMFEDVSGFGAWHRRWCVLSGHCISYWTYPDDERRKKPMGRINLASCTSRKVEPANREFCARPNTFELVTVRPQKDEDRETLVSQCRNTMCVTKNWLCADTKDERNLWMQKLNQVLVDLRMWQPDACYRPQQ